MLEQKFSGRPYAGVGYGTPSISHAIGNAGMPSILIEAEIS